MPIPALVHPVWKEAVFVLLWIITALNGIEDERPRVSHIVDATEPSHRAVKRPIPGDGLPNCQAIAPVDTTFALFKIDRIRGQVPVQDVPTVEVEVQSFLAN